MAEDPCFNYVAVNDITRRVSYAVSGDAADLNGDRRSLYQRSIWFLSWWRFTDENFNYLPNVQPPDNVCNARYAMWVPGAHPTAAGETSTAYAILGSIYYLETPVVIKNCGGYYGEFREDALQRLQTNTRALEGAPHHCCWCTLPLALLPVQCTYPRYHFGRSASATARRMLRRQGFRRSRMSTRPLRA